MCRATMARLLAFAALAESMELLAWPEKHADLNEASLGRPGQLASPLESRWSSVGHRHLSALPRLPRHDITSAPEIGHFTVSAARSFLCRVAGGLHLGTLPFPAFGGVACNSLIRSLRSSSVHATSKDEDPWVEFDYRGWLNEEVRKKNVWVSRDRVYKIADDPEWHGSAHPLHPNATVRRIPPRRPRRDLGSDHLKNIKDFIHEDGCIFIDVREPEKFAQGFIPGSINIPAHGLYNRTAHGLLDAVKDRPLAVFSSDGYESKFACVELKGFGFTVVDTMSVGVMKRALELQDLSVLESDRGRLPGEPEQQEEDSAIHRELEAAVSESSEGVEGLSEPGEQSASVMAAVNESGIASVSETDDTLEQRDILSMPCAALIGFFIGSGIIVALQQFYIGIRKKDELWNPMMQIPGSVL
eukprot:gnl/TRDRNA2_/TRDRNA2_41021_c0_seq1.p1 gnl/TRDRNA2_/TRDRNA2_41021_c0~~gnl/TRDRNA2_/TRDRNA2_41021_c0_seq1.p1  ORF type:complete len:415 (-),score=37.75 gnl/TRDRNA2_/TRDRNA2_41021_c0_seq1:20-1264(-)